MKKIFKFCLCLILVFTQLTSFQASANATESELEKVISETAAYIYEAVKNPQIGSIGGEWAVFGLARSGEDIPADYYNRYYKNVCDYVSEQNGILHSKKYTEYSRLILALTAIGKNPADVEGCNLLTPLGDYEKTIWQGLNGPIWALIALDCGGYEMPQNSSASMQATREMYVNRILECQLDDGGFSLLGGTSASENAVSDPDITGMALQALSKYTYRDDVRSAVLRALDKLSEMQDNNGGYSGRGTANSESTVQVLVALCELGIPLDDPRFVKNNKTLLDNVLSYYVKGNGFLHTPDGSGSNLMATEQAFYGLVAAKRFLSGSSTLYSITDSPPASDSTEKISEIGLKTKHGDIHAMPKVLSDVKFSDISEHESKTAIGELAKRAVINGKSSDIFDPDGEMTRAEFAAITVRGLGLPIKQENHFDDCSDTDWFFGYVNTAFEYGIVNGVSERTFNPSVSITLEESAAMLGRAAALCGIECDIELFEVRDILAGFTDYITISDWAMTFVAACVRCGIISDSKTELNPKHNVTRAEIAQMLFNLLGKAELL